MNEKRRTIIRKHLEGQAKYYNVCQTHRERVEVDYYTYQFIKTATQKEADEVRNFWEDFYEEAKIE